MSCVVSADLEKYVFLALTNLPYLCIAVRYEIYELYSRLAAAQINKTCGIKLLLPVP